MVAGWMKQVKLGLMLRFAVSKFTTDSDKSINNMSKS